MIRRILVTAYLELPSTVDGQDVPNSVENVMPSLGGKEVGTPRVRQITAILWANSDIGLVCCLDYDGTVAWYR